jgi:hypothetical protein
MVENPQVGMTVWYVCEGAVVQNRMQCMSGDVYYLASSPFDKDGDWRQSKDIWLTRQEAVEAYRTNLVETIAEYDLEIGKKAYLVRHLEAHAKSVGGDLESYKRKRDNLAEKLVALEKRFRS